MEMIDIHKIKGYLGYGVIAEMQVFSNDTDTIKYSVKEQSLDDILIRHLSIFRYEYTDISIKLKLRSIDDLTNEEVNTLNGLSRYLTQFKMSNDILLYIDIGKLEHKAIEYLQSIHIDYQDLIGQGLAIKKVVE